MRRRQRWSPATPVLRATARLARADVSTWCAGAYSALYGMLAERGVDPAGAAGATYAAEFFERDEGEVVAFVPVPPDAAIADDARYGVLPQQRFAVTLHSIRSWNSVSS